MSKIQIGDEVRDMTDDELANYDAAIKVGEDAQNALKEKQALRAVALAKLGLTADEVAALFG